MIRFSLQNPGTRRKNAPAAFTATGTTLGNVLDLTGNPGTGGSYDSQAHAVVQARYSSDLHDGPFNLRCDSVTISLCVFSDDWEQPNKKILSKWGAGVPNLEDGQLQLMLEPGRLLRHNSDHLFNRCATVPLTNGVWEHVAMVFDRTSSSAEILINCEPSGAISGIPNEPPALARFSHFQLQFGGITTSGGYQPKDGASFKMDNLRWYKAALTPDADPLKADCLECGCGNLDINAIIDAICADSGNMPTSTQGVIEAIAAQITNPELKPCAKLILQQL